VIGSSGDRFAVDPITAMTAITRNHGDYFAPVLPTFFFSRSPT
jgi:hypothetical protein